MLNIYLCLSNKLFMQNLNLENAVGYHYDKFPPIVDYQKIVPSLIAASSALARYDQMLKNLHNSEILLAPLRSQEAVISSRMEGTISTMDEIMKFSADEDDNKDNIFNPSNYRDDVIETILYQRALTNAQKAFIDGYKLTPSVIKAIHQQLLSFGRGARKNPGQFKTEQNYIGDERRKNISFVPISPEKLEEGLEKLFDYINNSSDTTLLKTALMHIEFEALHPFQDGNGRIGRMLITLLLWSEKIISQPHFYISGYLEENKDLYIELMRKVSEDNNWTEWCIFFFNAVENQANKNLEIADNIKNLYEEMKGVFADKLNSKWCLNALDYIFTNPIFRNNKFTSKSGIPAPTAQRFTRILQNEGILLQLEEASGRSAALYSFEPLMKLVRV